MEAKGFRRALCYYCEESAVGIQVALKAIKAEASEEEGKECRLNLLQYEQVYQLEDG